MEEKEKAERKMKTLDEFLETYNKFKTKCSEHDIEDPREVVALFEVF